MMTLKTCNYCGLDLTPFETACKRAYCDFCIERMVRIATAYHAADRKAPTFDALHKACNNWPTYEPSKWRRTPEMDAVYLTENAA